MRTIPKLLTAISFVLATMSCGGGGGSSGTSSRVSALCSQGCSISEECDQLEDQSLSECRSDCEGELEDAGDECLDAGEAYAQCASSASCDIGGECASEALALLGACPELVDSGGNDCCGATDTCDWAEDGFCDCGGAREWDAVDCADDEPGGAELGCCGATDTCDWAEDGFCDCGGDQAWDAVDCAP